MGDLQFLLSPRGLEIIQEHILDDIYVLRKWPDCIHRFVTNASSTIRLGNEYHNGRHAEAIMKTLQEWLGEQGNNATFGKLIELLRKFDMNRLCYNLVEKVEEIRNVPQQTTSTAIIENCRTPKIWFGMKDVPNFVGRVKELDTLDKLVTENRVNEEHDSHALLTVVHGSGGIGKTTLVKMYGWNCKYHFNVIWIDSETFSSMRSSFECVAEELSLELNTTNLDINQLTKFVYNAFVGSNCLFIFDNIESVNGPNGVKQFLPDGIIQKPYLLLTSRRNDLFTTNRILQLDVLSQSDSIDLVKKYFPNATNQIAYELAERLDRFPLAIHQAIAYINKQLPLQRKSSEDDVLIAINKFLKEYKYNSNRILKSEFIGLDGYGKNIFSICEMSLQKMENEDGGNLARHMLRYISFLNPDDIGLDFLINLPYKFESWLNKFKRIIRPGNENELVPNMTLRLLCSYSLVDINATEKTIKVHRLVQDAMRCMLSQNEELRYVKPLIASLAKPFLDKRLSLSHLITIKRSCQFAPSINYFESAMPKGVIELVEFLNSAGLNTELTKKLVKLANKQDSNVLSLLTPILKAMTCKDINKSVEYYLEIYFKVEKALQEKSTTRNLLLTNYIFFATFILPVKQKNIFQSVFECIAILNLKKCKLTLLLELLATNFPSEDVNIVLDVMNRCGIAAMSGEEFEIHYSYNVALFDNHLLILGSFEDEFPCLNYLNSSLPFTNVDELEALNLSWNFKNSVVWYLLKNVKYNLTAVRSAILCICYAGCTIAEYLEKYETTFEAMETFKNLGILVQFINANLLKDCNSKYYALLELLCCLPSKINIPYNLEHSFKRLDNNKFQFGGINLKELEKLGFIRKKKGIYYMNSHLQVAIRRNLLSLKDKTKIVKYLHKACITARKMKFNRTMIKYWRYIMYQEDLQEIALKCNLSLPKMYILESIKNCK